MKLRFLYTLGLLLCLSNFASPNECARHCPGAAASANPASSSDQAASPVASSTTPATASTTPAASSMTPAASSTAPAASASEPSAAAATQEADGQGDSYSPTLIKLLYI